MEPIFFKSFITISLIVPFPFRFSSSLPPPNRLITLTKAAMKQRGGEN